MRHLPSPIVGLILIVLAYGLTAFPAASDPINNSPREVVDRFHEGLASTLGNITNDTFQARREALCPVLQDTMNIPLQGAASVGRRAWNGWTPEQREAYSQQFQAYLCAQYADRFKAYDGETFVIVGERPGPRGAMIVETEVRVTDSTPVPIDYVLRSTSDGWAIADLFLDGTVSEVALRRAEFSAILRNQGFETLLNLMSDKTRAWETANH